MQVAQDSLNVAKALLEENRKQEQIGTMSHLDVVTAESQVAASARDLILAQTNLEQQVTTVKQLISKKGDPALDAATIVVTDRMPQPQESDLPNLRAALDTAQSNRPELKEAVNNLRNQDIAIAYTRNNQLPSLAAFGLAAGSGLNGNTALATSGLGGSLNQTFTAQYPEGAVGLSFSAIVRNRSAQATARAPSWSATNSRWGCRTPRIRFRRRCSRLGLPSSRASRRSRQPRRPCASRN